MICAPIELNYIYILDTDSVCGAGNCTYDMQGPRKEGELIMSEIILFLRN